MKRKVDIALDERDFQCLVRWGIIYINHLPSKQNITVRLQDIAYSNMYNMISRAEDKKEEIYKEHAKTIS